ncbi:MAG: shikimate dehydrogenase [Acetatifactor sp.]|nr:shikimate dehydrogenase [Acetatifactor sp.]
MNVNGFTRTCGLIGNPVEHTLSPVIHNTLAQKLGVNLTYVPFHVETGKLSHAVSGADALNLLGVNVTVPYKSDVIPFLADIDPLAKQIGAVNTLVRCESGFKGYNTDMPGLYRAMRADGVIIEGENVVILGAGGVARAVAMLLTEKKAAGIWLMNRTKEKAEKIAAEVNAYAGKEIARGIALDAFAELPDGKLLAIQATNVGMYPNNGDVLIEDNEFYKKIHTGYDLIFNPADTVFMQKARENGARAYNGLKMLLYQGIIAFELWTAQTVTDELAEEIYRMMECTINE